MSSKLDNFLKKLSSAKTHTFLLPTLQEEITYRKLDIIESSIDGSMPNFIASRVLDVMKRGLSGKETTEVDSADPTNEDVKEILVKATLVLEKALIEPKLTMEHIIQIPSEDRIAWFMEAVAQSYTSETTSGTEVAVSDIASFPEDRTARGNAKRSSNS